MIDLRPRLCAVTAALLACLLHAAPPEATPILPGLQHDGSVLLPNQWSLRPAGQQITVGDFPVNLAVHPQGGFVAVLHSGYSQHEIRLLELPSGKPLSTFPLDEAFYGLAWSPDGKHLYASGASLEVVHAFDFVKGFLSNPRAIRVRPAGETGIPIGLAPSHDGTALYVAEGWGQAVKKISLGDRGVLWSNTLAVAPANSGTDPEGKRWKLVASTDAAFPYAVVADEKHHRVFVSLWAQSAVAVLDSSTGKILARWTVGAHPNEMLLSRDDRLFVAEANLNTVSVLDARDGHLLEKLSAAFAPDAPPGATPNSLALTPDGRTLFVANANTNALAVFDVSDRRSARSLGFIPVGWYPTSVRVSPDGRTLLVANGKGVASAPNPNGPFPGDTRPRKLQAYIAGLFRGTVSVIDWPAEQKRAAQLGAWTRDALACSPISPALRPQRERPVDSPIPARVGEPSPLRHIIYVVRENRTYDQILGDLEIGNGARELCLFPDEVTPNAHALAREFTLLDNFYVDGEVSADGHEWTMGAYASDFVEKTWPMNYGHNARKKYDYPGEAAYAISWPSRGYLWDAAARAGVSYRSYGEFAWERRDKAGTVEPSIPVLRDHIDRHYRGFDLNFPDAKRADRFIAELQRFEREGEMPRLQVVRLGNDHTAGTRKGAWTPTAMVADNDLALGRIVEAVTKSKFWPTTAICILEDDAQNGPDHVDAHRSPAFIVSPYTKRRHVDSSLYSTTSMLRTIELILGLEPMSQFDAAAAPMFGIFQGQPDLTGFTMRTPRVDLDARNGAVAWGARESGKMDFREADRADDLVLNEIVWRSVKGANSPMPSPIRAAFVRPPPRGATGDDDD